MKPYPLFAAACCVALVVVTVLPFLVRSYTVFQLTLTMAYAIAILGLNLLTGFSKQISLGHGAFFAVGAYTAAVLLDKSSCPYWLTLPAAAMLCFVFGLLIGFPALRLGGHNLALATFALAFATPQLLKHPRVEALTGGVQGLNLTKPQAPFEFQLFGQELNADRWLYFVALIVAVLVFAMAWNVLRGRIGRALVAIGDHPVAASAMGINITVFKTIVFGISAGLTGLAGALSAIAVAFVSPDSFSVALSIILLVGLVVGGLASLPGAIFGAAFIQFLPNIADQISKSAPAAIYGLVLVLLMWLLPGGVMGGLSAVSARLRRQRVRGRNSQVKLPTGEFRRGV